MAGLFERDCSEMRRSPLRARHTKYRQAQFAENWEGTELSFDSRCLYQQWINDAEADVTQLDSGPLEMSRHICHFLALCQDQDVRARIFVRDVKSFTRLIRILCVAITPIDLEYVLLAVLNLVSDFDIDLAQQVAGIPIGKCLSSEMDSAFSNTSTCLDF
jgi:hypothetical protein